MGHLKYKQQLVVAFLTGDKDRPIQRGAGALEDRARLVGLDSPIIEVRARSAMTDSLMKTLTDHLSQLTADSRLYLMGHGDHVHGQLGGWTGTNVATLLKECGLTRVRIISVTGCQAGRGPLANNVEQVLQSFAGEFHRELGTGAKALKCDVYARVFNVQVLNYGQHIENSPGQFAAIYDTEEKQDRALGRKVTRKDYVPTEDAVQGLKVYVNHRPESKRKYYWEDGEQRWVFVEYDKENVTSFL